MKREIILILDAIAIIIVSSCGQSPPEVPAAPGASPVQTSAIPSPPPTSKVTSGLIAYIGADKQLWLMDPAGRNQQRLTAAGEAMSPAWSPNGQVLAYIYQEAGSKERRVHLYDPCRQTDHPIEAVCDERLALVRWSPNNRYLVLDSGTSFARDLRIVEVATGHIVNELVAYNYAWAPDGDRLVFGLRTPLETPISVEPGDSISLVITEVGQAQPPRVILEGNDQVLYFPLAWLPDGRILYDRLDWDERAQTGAHTRWTVTSDQDSEPRPAENIPPAYDRDAVLARLPTEMQRPDTGSFSWSTDGKWVVFHAGEGPNKNIYLFHWEEGGPPQHLADGTEPSWQPVPVECVPYWSGDYR